MIISSMPHMFAKSIWHERCHICGMVAEHNIHMVGKTDTAQLVENLKAATLRRKEWMARAMQNSVSQKPEPILTFQEVITAVIKERAYQDAKYGAIETRQTSLSSWLLIIQAELDEAKAGWLKGTKGRDSCLQELVQVTATCIACLQTHGTEGGGK